MTVIKMWCLNFREAGYLVPAWGRLGGRLVCTVAAAVFRQLSAVRSRGRRGLLLELFPSRNEVSKCIKSGCFILDQASFSSGY